MVTLSSYAMGTFGSLTLPRVAAFSPRPNWKRESLLRPFCHLSLRYPNIFCSQIEHIISASTTKLPAVGALTAANRDLWASDYVHLRSLSPSNAALLDTIHSASF